jgi:hypothetical protein
MATKKSTTTRSKRSTAGDARALACIEISESAKPDVEVIAHFMKLFEKKLRDSADEPVPNRAFDLAFTTACWVAEFEAFVAA